MPLTDLDAELRRLGCLEVWEPGERSLHAAGFEIFAKTRPGWIKTTSNLHVASVDLVEGDAALVVLAEGNYKDERSAIAAALLVREIATQFESPVALAEVCSVLERAAASAHREILATARSDLEGIGTCFTAAAISASGDGTLVYVGDCRASILSARGVEHVTVDHTLESEILAGRVQSEFPQPEHVVTRVLGFDETPPQLGRRSFTVGPSESLVLSSSLTRSTVTADLATADPKRIAQAMLGSNSFGRVVDFEAGKIRVHSPPRRSARFCHTSPLPSFCSEHGRKET